MSIAYILTLLHIFLAISQQIQSLRILISAPNYLYSHMAFHAAIGDLLVEEGGHQVTFLSPILNLHSDFPPKKHSNWTQCQRILRYSPKMNQDDQKYLDKVQNSPFAQPNVWEKEFELFEEETMKNIRNSIGTMCKAMLSDAKLISEFKAGGPFDVGIAEWGDGCAFALFHLLKIGATLSTSAIPMDFYMAKLFGIPTPVHFPDVNYSPPSGPQMGILERTRTFFRRMENKWEGIFEMDEWIQGVMGDGFPSQKELLRKSSFILVNTNQFLDLPRPTFAKVKNIGGFGLSRKKLEAKCANKENELMELENQRKKGIILVSFGSMADPRKMPPEMLDKFLDAFAAFPEHIFIWKFAENKGGNNWKKFPENVHKFGWINQRTILANPFIRLFISHCGLNSLNEAAFEGVPLLCIPLFGDQNYNAAIVNHLGVGKVLLKSELDGNSLKNALAELLVENNEFTRNMRRVANKMAKSPSQPGETILRHVEFAAEFGGEFDELNLEGAKMGIFTYFGMDFIFPLAFLAAIGLAILAKIFIILLRINSKYFYLLVANAKNKIE